MPSDVKPLGVRLVGSGPFRCYVNERLQLRRDFAIVDDDATQASASEACVVYLTGAPAADQVAAQIQSSQHVVLESIGHFSAEQLTRLAELAAAKDVVAVVDEPRRWDEDFLCARTVLENGRLGDPLLARLSIHESSLPGEIFPQGILRDLGIHWLDQLLVFAHAAPASARLRRFHDAAGECGFLAVIEFVNGLSALIELHTRSLLSLRTGWLLEGTAGAYRAGRQYTKAPDGEIIDEPVSMSARSTDPFFDRLSSVVRRESTATPLADLAHAARIMELIELLESSDRL